MSQSQTAQAMTAPVEGSNVVANAPITAQPVVDSKPPIPPQDPRIEQLMRKERALSKQMRDFQAQKQAFEQEKSKLLDSTSWKQKFLEDPTALGLSYDEISQRFLRQPSPEEQREAALRREIEAVKEAQQKTLEQVAKSQQDAYDQAKKQISREVSSLVEASKDYELVKAQGAVENVVSLIEETYKEEGVLLSTEEALKEVEDYLLEQATALLKLEKIQARLKPTPSAETPTEQSNTVQPQIGRVIHRNHSVTETKTRPQATQTTLTHAMSQASTVPAGNMSRRDRAIAAFKNQLK